MKTNNTLRYSYLWIKNSARIILVLIAPVIAAINRYIDGIDIKEEVAKFPVYLSSNEEFDCLKSKVVQAIKAFKEDNKATLNVSVNEINTVNARACRGNYLSRNPDFFHPPIFYSIEKEHILEQIMSAPGLYRFGYLHVTIAIEYIIKDGNIFEQQQLLESYGKRVEENAPPKIDIVPLERSKLIMSILKPIVDRSEIMPLIHSIQNLYIQDNLLKIEFASSSVL